MKGDHQMFARDGQEAQGRAGIKPGPRKSFMRWIKDKILWILGAVGGLFFLLWRSAQSKAHRAEVRQKRAEDVAEVEKSKSELKETETEIRHAEKRRKSLIDKWRADRDNGE